MILYDYHCFHCGKWCMDVPVKQADLAIYCERCGERMRRMPAAPAVRVKGGTPKFYARGKG